MKITVMLGGPSAEREVSLRSGAAVAEALASLGHEVEELDPADTPWTLPPDTDVVFLALHGTYGEDGTVQRELDALGVAYTGFDARASRTGFDKILSKRAFLKAGVPTAKFAVIEEVDAPWPAGWELPVVLKPACQGSSVGLRFVERAGEWRRALAESFRYGSPVLLEEKICGRETTVGILAGRALPVVEIRPHSGAYDYKSKYTTGASEYFCPAEFDAATTKRIQAAALAAFHAVGGRDYGRVDVMVRADGSPVVLEVNSLPGMTETSLLPKAATAAGMSFPELCGKMVELALQRAPVAV
ncbi:MAG: D-alanine--D-alanine ligase [Verrucomicrobia bacterium]|nr:D-alanine--D-alanine ligase [Verrucomicrobiota bacterium]